MCNWHLGCGEQVNVVEMCVCVYVLMTVPQTDSGLAEKEIHTAVDPVDF